jgi:hypothetical protein
MSKSTTKKIDISSFKENKYGRLLLSEQRKMAEFPDLLE